VRREREIFLRLFSPASGWLLFASRKGDLDAPVFITVLSVCWAIKSLLLSREVTGFPMASHLRQNIV